MTQAVPFFKGVEYAPAFELKNTEKYLGKPNLLTYDTDSEYKLMEAFDKDETVWKWGYHFHNIIYNSKRSKKVNVYTPAFYVAYYKNIKFKNNLDKSLTEYIIDIGDMIDEDLEVLTDEQYKRLSKKDKEQYDLEMNYVDNLTLKYKAADEFATKQGMDFLLYKEESGFVKFHNIKKFN